MPNPASTLHVGAAHNKLLSKMASAAAKPDGFYVVSNPAQVSTLLALTPAVKLPGCG